LRVIKKKMMRRFGTAFDNTSPESAIEIHYTNALLLLVKPKMCKKVFVENPVQGYLAHEKLPPPRTLQ